MSKRAEAMERGQAELDYMQEYVCAYGGSLRLSQQILVGAKVGRTLGISTMPYRVCECGRPKNQWMDL